MKMSVRAHATNGSNLLALQTAQTPFVIGMSKGRFARRLRDCFNLDNRSDVEMEWDHSSGRTVLVKIDIEEYIGKEDGEFEPCSSQRVGERIAVAASLDGSKAKRLSSDMRGQSIA